MDVGIEIEVMRLFEAALAEPEHARAAWLAAQRADANVLARVRELLASESAMTRFLEASPAAAFAAAASPAAAVRPGDRLGNWELVRPLDAGGMGVVFLARRVDGSYERDAAVKFVRTDHVVEPRLRERLLARFEEERRLLARVEHPNVARVLDGGSTPEGLPYLVMEYVEGLALDAWCDRRGAGIGERVRVFCKVCDGVQAAHRHLIVHRDLKPGNILVGADGEPRLLDFGIARALDMPGEDAGQTQLHAMTPAYASPEQLRMEPLTTASDVYSLGVVLYELLSGTRPHALEGLSPAQRERVVCETAPATLRRALGAAPLPEGERRKRLARIQGDLERIVAKALHRDPARRYESASALADDLRRWLDGRPVLAHPDSTAYRVGKFVRRHRVGATGALLAFAAIVAAVAVALLQAREARRAAADTGLVNAYLIDVLGSSNPYAEGSEITLSDALDDAAGKVDERFGDRPDLAVGIRNALSESMFARFRLEQAERQALRARADGERVFGTDDPRTVQAIALLASIRKDQSRFDEAQVLFDEALARLERSGRTALPLYATVLNDVGVMHLVAEDFAGAQGYLERAAAADRGGSDTASVEERARTLANLAQAARGVGDLDRADLLYRRAQPVLEQLYPDGGPHLAVILNNRAKLAWLRGQRGEAIDLQRQAVAMHRRSFSGDHAMVLVPMTNLARMLFDAGDAGAALEWGEQAVAMADRLYADGGHFYQANALASLANIQIGLARHDEATALLARARAVLARLETVPESTREFVAGLERRICEAPDAASRPASCNGN